MIPRGLSRSIEQLRRDVRMVVGGLTGRKAVPFSSRSMTTDSPREGAQREGARREGVADDASARAATLLAPRTVRVARVVRETPDAVTLELEDPNGAPFHFTPGQFFTLLVPIGDEVRRRAYSASSLHTDASRVAITIKRVAGGAVSNHVNDHVREGDLVQILGPSGSFVAEPSAATERHLVLIAGGSGITPMMAISRAILAGEPRSRVTLVYGNRSVRDVIFRAALDELAAKHGARFHVRHVIQDAQDAPEGWTGGVGVLEERVVGAELDACEGLDLRTQYFICGPEPMMRAARDALRARNVPDANVLEERFTQPHLRAKGRAATNAGPQLLTIRANGSGAREIYVAPEQTLLEAGLSAGLPMDYSCAMGGCAACKVRLCDGEVEMEEPNCLTADERGHGYVLACVARMKTPATIALASDASFAATSAPGGANGAAR